MLIRSLAAAIVFVCSGPIAHAGAINNLTVKSVQLENAWGQGALWVRFNEPINVPECAFSNNGQVLAIWEANAPGPWVNSMLGMLMAAQAQDLKVDVIYTSCNDLMGAMLTGIKIHR